MGIMSMILFVGFILEENLVMPSISWSDGTVTTLDIILGNVDVFHQDIVGKRFIKVWIRKEQSQAHENKLFKEENKQVFITQLDKDQVYTDDSIPSLTTNFYTENSL